MHYHYQTTLFAIILYTTGELYTSGIVSELSIHETVEASVMTVMTHSKKS